MNRRKLGGALAAVSAAGLMLVAASALAVEIRIQDDARANPGGRVDVAVTIDTQGMTVVGTQNSIEIQAGSGVTVDEKMVMIQLSAAINAAAVNIPVTDTTRLENVGTVLIENETIDYAGINRSTNTLTGAVRGSAGTTAAAHAVGTAVRVPQGIPNCISGDQTSLSGFFAYTTTNGVNAIVLSFGATDIEPIQSGATLYTCSFTVPASATAGSEIVLSCPTSSSSDEGDPDVEPMPLPTDCVAGRITVVTGCIGDANGDGAVSAGEFTRARNDFTRGGALRNTAADANGDGTVSAGEFTRVRNNFTRGQCRP
jgi:hypothetical protein